ncbi:MAG: IS3 family transposase [Lachnospiraceae bacterium]|nr:IS3 family transposase [Lachnospiraceae bacterium]
MKHSVKKLWNTILITKRDMESPSSAKLLMIMAFFHSVMKKEEIYLHEYQDFEEAKSVIFEYIESWYNRKRIHSALGYKTPQQVEDEAVQAA